MLNPFKLLAIYSDLNKIEAVAKEKATMTVKTTQILTLVISLLGTVGVPALATSWLHAHLGIYAGFVAAAILLHAIFPSIFAAPSAAVQQAAGLTKTSAILLMIGLGLMLPGRVNAQTTTTTTTSSSLFSAFAGPVAVNYGGNWSAATLSKQLFDFKDFGANQANHLYLGSYQLIAPTPSVNAYFGVIGYQPDLTKLFKSTNLPSGTFGLFVDAGAGIANLPSQNTTGWLAGGGFLYRVNSTVQWNVVEAYYTRIGNQSVPVVSTSIGAYFGGTK